MAKILFFGASTVAFRKNIVVASQLFAEKFPQHQIINKGVPGNHTDMGRERFERDVLAEHPDLLIFSFGINDAAIDVYKQMTTPRVTLERYRENLRYFIREIRAAGGEALFFTPQPMVMTENLKTYYGGEPYTSKGFNFMLDIFLDAARDVMKEEGVGFADINALFRKITGNDEKKLLELLPDGMHPSSAGQELIFQELCRVLEKIPLPL